MEMKMEANNGESQYTDQTSQGAPSSNGAGGPNGPTGDGIVRGTADDRKIFVGGISGETTSEDLIEFFKQFGGVEKAEVKYDHLTSRPRGFAFVEFADSSSVTAVLKQKFREIKGKNVEVKPAASRENKKIFVGGLPYEWTEEQLKSHFEKYGKVEDIEWPFDRQRGGRRNFAFVVFELEACADAAARETQQQMGERTCNVKKFTAQGRGRGGGGMGGYMPMGARGMPRGRGRGFPPGGPYGGYGARGGYGAGAGYGYGGGWGDWYGGAGGGSAYGSYYGSQGGYGTGYEGYDYSGASAYPGYGTTPGWEGAAAGAEATPGYDAYGAAAATTGAAGGSWRGASTGHAARYQPY